MLPETKVNQNTTIYGFATQKPKEPKFNVKKWTSYLKGDVLSNFPHTNTATGPDGTDWIGPVGGGVSCFDGIKWETYTVSDAFDLEYVKAIIKAPDGSMWFGTEGEGVYRFDGKD